MPIVSTKPNTQPVHRSHSDPEDLHLLSPKLRGPQALLFAWVAPLFCLAALNARSHWLVWSELSPSQTHWSLVWIFAVVLNLSAAVVTTFWLHKTQRRLTPSLALIPLFFQVAHIIFSTLTLEHWFPSNIQDWMLNENRVHLLQWTLVMPTAFYSVAVLSGFPLKSSIGREIGKSLAVIVLVPLCALIAFQFLDALRNHSSARALQSLVLVTTLSFAGIGLFAAITRLLLVSWIQAADKNPTARLIASLAISLFLPLAGLWLNSEITFPANFQHPLIYAFTVVNAIALTLPTGISERRNLSIGIARCLCFPFTAYFFFVFLPYIPLSIPAMLAFGSGFLVLAPSMLFILHLQKLHSSYKSLTFNDKRIAGIGLASVSIVPALLLTHTMFVKSEINRSLDFVFHPDFSQEQTYSGVPYFATVAFDWLNEFKGGTYYPILTPLRIQLLFNSLTLSDKKLARVHETFTGRKFAPVNASNDFGIFFDDTRPRNSRRINRLRSVPPLPSASLQQLSTSTIELEDQRVTGTRIRIEMQGAVVPNSEFKAKVQLPQGTWVAGIALYIGDERVDGRLFEKNAALWAYRMVRDEDRAKALPDPATLNLENDGSLSLQVFPFAANQRRVLEIDVVSLSNAQGSLLTDKQNNTFEIEKAKTQIEGNLGFETKNGYGLFIPDSHAFAPFAVQRQPFLHVFIDRSYTGLSAADIKRQLASLQKTHRSVEHVKLTLVNLNAISLFEEPVDWKTAFDTLNTVDLDSLMPLDHGFFIDPALSRAALKERKTLSASTRFPVWTLLENQGLKNQTTASQPLRTLTPESSSRLLRINESPLPHSSTPVALFKKGDVTQALAFDEKAGWLLFPHAPDDAPIECFDPQTEKWQTLEVPKNQQPFLQQAANFALFSHRADMNPAFEEAHREALVLEAKNLNLLNAATAFVVMENQAQWKALAIREEQKLRANGALDFDETPEPPFYILLAILAIAAGVRKLRQPAQAAASS